MVTIRPNEIVKHFETAGQPCTEERIKKMRTGTQLQRGGKISEQDAKVILEMVDEKAAKLLKLGVINPFTDEQKESCIETFTGVPHPKKMLDSAVKGELAIGELVSKTCERQDLNHNTGDRNFCEQVGISHMSGFVTGKSSLEPETAEKMANWFAANYDFNEQQQKQFVTLARGVKLQRTPDIILDEFAAGTIGRVPALREIYDYSGLSRPALAEKAGVEFHAIQYSTTETSGGRIMADKNAIKRIAQVCGVSEGRVNEFVNTYDGKRVSRQSVISSKGDKDDGSWGQHAKDTKSTGGWAQTKTGDSESD
jgi:transcriptional regulator with XRE-family HTH domain